MNNKAMPNKNRVNNNDENSQRDKLWWSVCLERGTEGQQDTHNTKLGRFRNDKTRSNKDTISREANKTANKICNQGACALGEALKVNATLTTLDLQSAEQDNAKHRHSLKKKILKEQNSQRDRR